MDKALASDVSSSLNKSILEKKKLQDMVVGRGWNDRLIPQVMDSNRDERTTLWNFFSIAPEGSLLYAGSEDCSTSTPSYIRWLRVSFGADIR